MSLSFYAMSRRIKNGEQRFLLRSVCALIYEALRAARRVRRGAQRCAALRCRRRTARRPPDAVDGASSTPRCRCKQTRASPPPFRQPP
jgi:hypothetical protein